MKQSFILCFKRIACAFYFLFSFFMFAQKKEVKYEKGILKGVFKVKFIPSVEKKLNNSVFSVGNSGSLETGIISFDAMAQTLDAKKMERLFPYNPKYEHKLRKHGLHLWYLVEVSEEVNIDNALVNFRRLSEITIAEPFYEKTLTPYTITSYNPTQQKRSVLPFNDPGLKDQWHYKNEGQTGYPEGADINLFEAWKKTAGKSDIIVAVHDEGVDVNHPDLKANMWINYAELNGLPGVDDDGNGYIDDIHGYNFDQGTGEIDAQSHGTHVAGTISAVNNNGIGVSGIAGGTGNGDGVKIMSLESVEKVPIIPVERSYIYAADNGAVISQNSWGYEYPDVFEQSVLDAIDYFIEEAGDYQGSPMKGGIVIFSTGNNNLEEKRYPAYYDKVLSVSALAPTWKKTSYSNYGTWVDISAPGGEMNLGEINGVLSTLPNARYGYMQGTSMACPHVSGIAALALSARDKKMVNTELWTLLTTSVVNIDTYNPQYIGKLGTGAINASLAVKNNLNFSPEKINDLEVEAITQEFVVVQWTVPEDKDDGTPLLFYLYYSTEPITLENLSKAKVIELKNDKKKGEVVNFQIDDLSKVTQYNIAVIAVDRWGNRSELSNIAVAITNTGPSIEVDDASKAIVLNLDMKTQTSAFHPITILDNAEGLLRWNHIFRNTSITLSPKMLRKITYPTVKKVRSLQDISIGTLQVQDQANFSSKAFTGQEKSYITDINGVTGGGSDISNSAAIKYIVDEAEGFNLTEVSAFLKISNENSPVILEIYQGEKLEKENLIAAQKYDLPIGVRWYKLPLEEQIYFEKESTFWLVVHVPSGNTNPLGIGAKTKEIYSEYCFVSFDVGNTWEKLSIISSDWFAWAIKAVSNNPNISKYLVLDPGSGEIKGYQNEQVTLKAEGSNLVNGTYKANLILLSNDSKNKELRVPITVNIKGQEPLLKYPDIVEFGSVFLTENKTMEFIISNEGYGNYNDIKVVLSDPQFEVVSAVSHIEAKSQVVFKVKYTPNKSGIANATLTISGGAKTHTISLFGIGADNAKITVTPEEQTIKNITLGDIVTAGILQIKNEGVYPLKYFIPGYDNTGISNNWPSKYHSYGYYLRSNEKNEKNPLPYDFTDISSVGVDITEYFLENRDSYKEVELDFKFPYYGEYQDKIYIAQNGFTTFDGTIAPVFIPSLGMTYSPKGYISLLGMTLSYVKNGKAYYKKENDKFIVQYHKVGPNAGITAQMVLFANGDIRFYYDKLLGDQRHLNILIEDKEKKDGILLHSYNKQIELHDKLVLGLDYPGPNIITSIVNGSGIILPGNTVEVKVTLDTQNTTEGNIKRYVNFITNDPYNRQKNALINLDIIAGGTSELFYTSDTLDFGEIYKGDKYNKDFSILNKGNGIAHISSIKVADGKFSISGNISNIELGAGLSEGYTVSVQFNELGEFEDVVEILFPDNTVKKIYLYAKVVNASEIVVNNADLLDKTLNYGEISEKNPFSFTNQGGSDLVYSIIEDQWFSFNVEEGNPNLVENDYSFLEYKQGNEYNWINILETGVHFPFFTNPQDSWYDLSLPFPVKLYGKEYMQIKIAMNGIISVDKDPEIKNFKENLPTKDKGGYIIPLWFFGGINITNNPDEKGVFYQFFDDKIVITWEKLDTGMGMEVEISIQVIFYKDGKIKYQYKTYGVDSGPLMSVVGLQEPGTGKYMKIFEDLSLNDGEDLAYVILPTGRYTLSKGQTVKGNIVLDARNTFGGEYNSNLQILTNDPVNKQINKPIKMTVLGQGKLVTIDTINVGRFELGNETKTYFAELNLNNEGTNSIHLTKAVLEKKDQFLNQLIFKKESWSSQWVPISQIFTDGSNEKFLIRPGETMMTKITFIPKKEGTFVDKLTLTTELGTKEVIVMGEAFYPPKLEVDRSVINVSVNNFNLQENRELLVKNTGKSELMYQAYVEYFRKAELSDVSVFEKMSVGVSGDLSIAGIKEARSGHKVFNFPKFSQLLKYFDQNVADTFMGIWEGDNRYSFIAAVKFQVGNKNFNLSDIGTVMKTTEGNENVELEYEVRSGHSIEEAILLAKGKVKYKFTSYDGVLVNIKLDKEVLLYPREEFYVIIKYPSGMQNPQGVINNAESKEQRYLFYTGFEWVDVQAAGDLKSRGLMIFAGERNPVTKDIAWLKIITGEEGTMQQGTRQQMKLLFDSGLVKTRGDHSANIIFTSNDTSEPVIKIPALLHVNEAPKFVADSDKIKVSENTQKEVVIFIKDSENNAFELVEPPVTNSIFTYTFTKAEHKLRIVLTPDYGDAGTYKYTFKVVDEFGAEGTFVLSVEVVKSNQAPVYIGDDAVFIYKNLGEMAEYKITDLFEDPDNDPISYTAVNEAPSVIDTYFGDQTFVIKTVKEGVSNINFEVKDDKGASVNKTLIVRVNPKGSNVYPNPFTNKLYTMELEGYYEIYDFSGRLVREGNFDNSTLNLESYPKGVYYLKIKSKNGRSIEEKIIKD